MNYLNVDNIDNFPAAKYLKEFLIGHPGIIAGGCFKSVFTGAKPHDVDMFFRNKEDMLNTIDYFKSYQDLYEESYKNKNVKSFIHKKTNIRIECVRKIFGTPSEILDQFDFTITKFAYEIESEPPEDEDDSWHYNDSIIYHPQFFEHLMQNRLVVDDDMPYPVSTFNRCFKYARSGFFPCRETKMKILNAIHSLDNIQETDLSKALYEGHD